MPLFNVDGRKLSPVREIGINLEKDIQKITESNLEQIFNLRFIASEYSLHNFRIDTLAFDEETNSFVVIEYKRDKSFSVIDQGYTYLSLMLNNKADFVLLYNEKTEENLRKEDIDWSQSRVLFLANSFTNYQQNAINFRDLPIELWEVKMFDNSTILYNRLISPESNETIKTITKNKAVERVNKEIKNYVLDDHLRIANGEIKNLFMNFRERVMELGNDIEERAKKKYIAYRTRWGFLFAHLQKTNIKLHIIIHKNDLDDPKKVARDVTNIGHYGGGVTEINLNKPEDLPYIMTLVEQSYLKSKQYD